MKIKYRRFDYLLILFATLLFSCSSPKVVYFANEQRADTEPSSYHLENRKAERAGNEEKAPIIIDLENAVRTEMAAKGYLEVDRNAELKLRYEIVANKTTNYSLNQTPFRQQTLYNQSYFLNSPFNYREFTESILLIEIRDAGTERIIWQGSLDMQYSQRAKDTKEIVLNAVKMIFETYPYTANSN